VVPEIFRFWFWLSNAIVYGQKSGYFKSFPRVPKLWIWLLRGWEDVWRCYLTPPSTLIISLLVKYALPDSKWTVEEVTPFDHKGIHLYAFQYTCDLKTYESKTFGGNKLRVLHTDYRRRSLPKMPGIYGIFCITISYVVWLTSSLFNPSLTLFNFND
jgi:hypothetical protein